MSPSIPTDIRDLVEKVCKDMGLNPFAPRTVERWVRLPQNTWPGCCDSGCDPCNADLRRAALAVLSALEKAS